MALLLKEEEYVHWILFITLIKKYKREGSSFDMGIVNEDNEKDIILDF
jgi:hypothetical protein